MNSSYFVGLDLGGTGAKAAVYDNCGRLISSGYAGYMPVTSAEGYTEIPIEEIYNAARDAVRQATQGYSASIKAMAVSSQGQTFVSLDRHDRPLHNAIIWYDSRAQEEASIMQAAIDSVPSTEPHPFAEAISSAPKILWLKNKYPEIMEKASLYLLLPEYFSYRLTGNAVTDPCTASSTGLYADDAKDYSETALSVAEIDKSQAARIQASGTAIGIVKDAAAEEFGLPDGVVLVTGTNDQYAGALGAGNSRPGIVTETTGTCLALVTLTEMLPSPLPVGLFGGRFPIAKYQFALAYSKTAGVVLDWYRKSFFADKSFDELNSAAEMTEIGSKGLTFLPHFDGTVSPIPNPNAKGFICDLTLNHSPADIYRSILESISFSLRENIDFLYDKGFNIDVVRSIGGGAKSDFWLQMKADVINVPVEKPKITEAATLGAAMLAAVGYGMYDSVAECSENFYHVDKIFEPNKSAHDEYCIPYGRYLSYCKKIYPK